MGHIFGGRVRRAPLFRVAVVGLLAVLAAMVPFSAAGAKGPHKHPLSYYSEHPCLMITRSEAKSVYGAPMGAGQVLVHGPYGGQCEYSTTGSVAADQLDFSITSGTAASAKKFEKAPFNNEKSVGHHAFCSGDGNVFADVGNLDGVPSQLIVASSGCATAVKFAKIAFAGLS